MNKAIRCYAASLAAFAVLMAAAGCGAKLKSGGAPAHGTGDGVQVSVEKRNAVPGEPTLVEGASNNPFPREQMPMPKFAAQAGIDFPADRFTVIFEASPTAQSLAPFLSGDGQSQGADAVWATDNAPLVDHPYFRMVSVNLAAHYGLEIERRVFFRDVNFAVYKAKDIDDVSKLDALMMKVLTENQGLVEEVGYDFYVSAFEPIGGEVYYEIAGELVPADGNPAGFKFLPDFLKSEGAADVNRTVSAPPDDPMHLNKSGSDGGTWANWRVGTVDGKAWDKTTGSASVIVADIDTGVRYTHQDLSANMIVPAETPPYNEPGILTDVVNKDNDPNDDHGHGTNVAGCIGAVGNNGVGLAGMNHTVTILPIKVLASSGSGTWSGVAEGMLLANYLGAHILNLSLGGSFPDRTTRLAAIQCNNDGRLVVVAAGNSYTDAPGYPAYYPECLAVGATTLVNSDGNQDFTLVDGELPVEDRYDARAGFSNYGDWVDIAAPGVSVRTTSRASDSAYTAATSGTSFACPYTAGCAALLWAYISQFETPTNHQVRELLQGSARIMEKLNNGANPKGFKDSTSNGLVRFLDVNAAMELYESGAGIAYDIEWDNPVDGATVTGGTEIRLSVSGGTGSVIKVEFETDTRFMGSTDTLDDGFYRLDWDTNFEFNRRMSVTASVITDEGRITRSTIWVTPDNERFALPFLEDFTDVADNELAGGWFRFNGNKGTGATQWGADPSQFATDEPSMHSSGTSANYAARSSDWLFMPIIDLTTQAAAGMSYQRRYQMGHSQTTAYLFVTADDRSYSAIASYSGTTLEDWDVRSHSLAAWAGREVRAFWVLVSTNNGNSGPGLWLDDVEVTGAEGTPPSIQVVSPANGSTESGVVSIELELENVERIRLYATPPDFGGFLTYDTDATDTELTISWDSRYVYNGGALLTLMGFDNDDEDNLLAVAYLALNVNNDMRNPRWGETFEDIGELGGLIEGEFDGDWYVWGSGSDYWHVTEEDSKVGDKSVKFGKPAGGDLSNAASGRLYGPVHNPDGESHPFLRLWQKLDLGTGDVARIVLVRYDGLDETEVIIAEYRSDIADWTEQYFDLTFAGDVPFRILFRLNTNSDGNNGTGWFIDDYEVFIAGARITSIVDPSGAPGKTVTVSGSYFGPEQGTSTITFAKQGGGRTEPTVNSWSDTAIEVVVPDDAVSGNVLVNVQGYDSNGYYFGVTLPPPNLTGAGRLY